ncbi:MAG: hypothetical protein SGJ19_02800 [Planctomycetia bacterium]|nr:hypothetical protein [Planctomycetia bacterium]
MNVTSTKLGARRLTRQGCALTACLATMLLGGCSLKRSATWDRVTHPDFMYEEHTTLHGFHRTSWDSWPEEYRHSGWSRHVDKSVEQGEKLPDGEPSQELPQPEVQEEGADIPEQGDAPEARTLKPGMSKRPARRPLASTPAVVPATPAILPEVELVAGSATVAVEPPTIEIPFSLDAAPSPWTDRFASLIAADRKSKWRELNEQETENSESPRPVRHEDASAAPRPLEIMAEPLLEETPQPSTQGDGAVQFRLRPASPEVVLREADELPASDEEVQLPVADTK